MTPQQFALYTGCVIAFLGIAVLFYMAFKARKYKGEDTQEARAAHYQKLIILNFIGVGFGVIGIILIFLQRVF